MFLWDNSISYQCNGCLKIHDLFIRSELKLTPWCCTVRGQCIVKTVYNFVEMFIIGGRWRGSHQYSLSLGPRSSGLLSISTVYSTEQMNNIMVHACVNFHFQYTLSSNHYLGSCFIPNGLGSNISYQSFWFIWRTVHQGWFCFF